MSERAIDPSSLMRPLRSLDVQQALLPTELPQVPGLSFDAVYAPAEDEQRAGGDWFDAFTLADGRVVVSIGEVSGRGLRGAVTMSSIRHGLRVLANQPSGPDLMLGIVDATLARDYPDAAATAVVGIIDVVRGTLTYANCGHPAPMLRTPGGQVVSLPGSGSRLGTGGGALPDVNTVPLAAGTTLVFYTDGLLATAGDKTAFEERMRASLGHGDVGLDDAAAHTIRRHMLASGHRDDDDVAVLTVRVLSAGKTNGGERAQRWLYRADDARSAESARAGFRSYLEARGVPDANYAAAELVFGELVGNVVRHAPGPITVELDWDDDAPVLHVIDRGEPFDVAAALPTSLLSESGRGLFLVSVLADDFTVTPLPEYGNHARVRLRIERLDEVAERVLHAQPPDRDEQAERRR